ncbi:tol-pal system protein YbgF [Aquabacterium sp. J223]|uniref:tol-pal system protein YbgF n=1 Tax=Aquabacterium sp. J223 TaxID=2898431 RepID=UPI0021AD871B|nr:tol-pal system protein YbgF [Aquabacterium sp. J223]UUX94687.1 tol-pal system protein YbgF [Aquabacterium sp. J223]
MRAPTSSLRRRAAPWALALAAAFAPLSASALFSDDEARRAILELRARLDEQARARQTEQAQLTEQIQQLRRSLLEATTAMEALRGEIAQLRGRDEQLARDVAEVQRRQRDISQGVEERIRKLEPQKVSLDGKEFLVEADEKRQYEEAVALLRNGDFPAASSAFSALLKRYPASGYADAARFWLGNALYGRRDYAGAIASFRGFVSGAPEHPRAPEALLAIANCQIEMKDSRSARRTLEELLKTYPKSEAAQAGRDRMAALK